MVLHADRVRFAGPRDITPLESYCTGPIEFVHAVVRDAAVRR